jgi:hypothetical protein
MSEFNATISAADVWHDRLTQFSHRAGSLGCLILLAGLYGKHGISAHFCIAFSIFCGITGLAGALFAWIFIPPEDGNIRESQGVFLFCLGLALGGWLIAWMKGFEVYVPYLADWLLLRFDFLGANLANPAAWSLRVGIVMLAIWIGVTSALTRKARE